MAGSLNASVAMWLLTIGRLTAPYIAAQGTALGRRGRVYVEEDSDGTGWIGGTTTTCTSGTVGLRPYTECYTDCMTSVQIPTRFRDDELADLDSLVADGVAESRSQVIRLAVERLFDAHRRRTIGEQIAAAYRTVPQTDDEHAWAVANAIALTEAEPW